MHIWMDLVLDALIVMSSDINAAIRNSIKLKIIKTQNVSTGDNKVASCMRTLQLKRLRRTKPGSKQRCAPGAPG